MKPKTEELLYYLLWSADLLMRPTYRNLSDSFETWAYRNGLSKQLAVLERQRLIERQAGRLDARVYRLTEQGRLRALAGRDPMIHWSSRWDGLWRLVLFDLPAAHNSARARLTRYLRQRGFGCLQKSVWITPHTVTQEVQRFAGEKCATGSFIVIEGRPGAGEKDAEIVGAAWDFDRINSLYRAHRKILSAKPRARPHTDTKRRSLRRWALAERVAWARIVSIDPFLPQCLLPSGYLGQRVWQERVRALAMARQCVESSGAQS